MKKKLTILLLLSFLFILRGFAQDIKSPSEFLGYNLGEHFTPYYRVLEYVNYLSTVKVILKYKFFIH